MTVIAAAVPAGERVLVIADWSADPHAVIAACVRRASEGRARFALVVPACDALQTFAAREILVCRDRPRRAHPLDLPHRLRRMTSLPVDAPALRERGRRRAAFGAGHCVAGQAGGP